MRIWESSVYLLHITHGTDIGYVILKPIIQAIKKEKGSQHNYFVLLFSILVLEENDSAAAQQYVRQGCPTAHRGELWALILNVSDQTEVRQKASSLSQAWMKLKGASSAKIDFGADL